LIEKRHGHVLAHVLRCFQHHHSAFAEQRRDDQFQQVRRGGLGGFQPREVHGGIGPSGGGKARLHRALHQQLFVSEDQVHGGTIGGGRTHTVDPATPRRQPRREDRKSTRLNSSHVKISYAV